jgi:hypothetical protein
MTMTTLGLQLTTLTVLALHTREVESDASGGCT